MEKSVVNRDYVCYTPDHVAPHTPTTHQLSILISLKEKLSSLSIKSFPQGLLNNKYIVVMGGSIQRSIYKDLITFA
jgi:hypothetical protein